MWTNYSTATSHELRLKSSTVYSTACSGNKDHKSHITVPLWGESAGTGRFPSQRSSNMESVSISLPSPSVWGDLWLASGREVMKLIGRISGIPRGICYLFASLILCGHYKLTTSATVVKCLRRMQPVWNSTNTSTKCVATWCTTYVLSCALGFYHFALVVLKNQSVGK